MHAAAPTDTGSTVTGSVYGLLSLNSTAKCCGTWLLLFMGFAEVTAEGLAAEQPTSGLKAANQSGECCVMLSNAVILMLLQQLVGFSILLSAA